LLSFIDLGGINSAGRSLNRSQSRWLEGSENLEGGSDHDKGKDWKDRKMGDPLGISLTTVGYNG
jgi:hypothetical protein